MGPGVWFDEAADVRRVHIRLSPTDNKVPGWDDYEPVETDPNNLRLALSREEDYAIFLTNCHHITFRDLTLRFGSPDTIRLNTCTHITFDHCRIRSGTRAIHLLTGNGARASARAQMPRWPTSSSWPWLPSGTRQNVPGRPIT
jgi:hypothetical protein